MSIEERIEYAEAKRDEAISDGTMNDIVYWNGYLAGVREVQGDFTKEKFRKLCESNENG